MEEVTERELAFYGFSPLVWLVLALTERTKFAMVGIDKNIVMGFFWISIGLFVLGITGLLKKPELVYRASLGLSVWLGIIGFIVIGLIGHTLSLVK